MKGPPETKASLEVWDVSPNLTPEREKEQRSLSSMANNYIEYVHVTKHPLKITEQQGSNSCQAGGTASETWETPQPSSLLICTLWSSL